MPNKIESAMTAEELADFLGELAGMRGITLAKIQEAARGRGIEISLMGATSFRDKNLAGYLARMREASAGAKMIADAISGGAEGNILDGAALILSQKLNDVLMADEVQDLKEIRAAIAAVARLRASNSSEKLSAARLREYEAAEAARRDAAAVLEERKHALVKRGGISEDALALIEAQARLLA